MVINQSDKQYIAVTKRGVREIGFNANMGYYYTDCTHPMQQLLCWYEDIIYKEYIDKSDELQKMKLISMYNKYETKENNRKLSEEFLSTVKPSIFMKLIYFIKSLKHG